jgi:hypothetical protein
MPDVHWLNEEQLSEFLITRAAVVQRVREMLPPEVSRKLRRPVAVFADGVRYLLFWSEPDAAKRVVCGIECAVGLRFLSPEQVSAALKDHEQELLPKTGALLGEWQVAKSVGRCEALKSPDQKDKDSPPELPKWAATLLDEALNRFFGDAEPWLREAGVDPQDARRLFEDAAASNPAKLPEWFAEAYGAELAQAVSKRLPALVELTSTMWLFTEATEQRLCLALAIPETPPRNVPVRQWITGNIKEPPDARSTEHLEAVFNWNLAHGLHGEAFDRALENVEGHPSGAEIWRTMREGRTDESRSRLPSHPVTESEYQKIRKSLADDRIRAGIELPPSPGSKGVHLTAQELPFYEGYVLYTVHVRARRYRFIAHWTACESSPLKVLNGTSPPIHELNAELRRRGELKITDESVAAYLRFFCDNVHGEEGAFTIVERMRDLDWRYVTDDFRKRIQRINYAESDATEALLPPVSLIHRKQGLFTLAAHVTYARGLFLALFQVAVDGRIEMPEDISLFTNLPVHPRVHRSKRDTAFALLG